MVAYEEHMPGCEDHSSGDCTITREIKDGREFLASVAVVGLPCDHARIDVDGHLIDAGDVAAYVRLLSELTPTLALWSQKADCTGQGHNHDDDEPTVCKGCGESGVAIYFLAEVGYRCEACWAKAGVPIPSGWKE